MKQVLLLNASNMESFPVYPYAFIQVPAIAQQYRIKVICQDLLGVPQERWMQTIEALIGQTNPVMILITLRNTDTLGSSDYETNALKGSNPDAYFPVERTRDLISIIRKTSQLKIAVGGFGFSLLPAELMHYLRPDIGVYEGPNDFFAKFEEIMNGNLDNVANLLFFKGKQLISNPRRLYPPLKEAEYTFEAIERMMDFYAAFPSPGFQGAAVEIMRGCNHSCVFCAEPHAKGARVRYRDLSIVMKDIAILVGNGVTRIYMVSSELNPEGNGYVLELADRIWSFNKSLSKDKKIIWYGANYLLKFDFDEYERLYRSGFTNGWFDITALDDDNARAMRTPYRNLHLLGSFQTYIQYQKKNLALLRCTEEASSQVKVSDENRDVDERSHWTMFLGNPATTVETIRNTLQVAHQEGLSQLFGSCHINPNIRIFDYEGPDDETMNVTYSVTQKLERTHYRQVLPSFAYPPALLKHFGSEEEIKRMFDHIADTYLSRRYLETRNWSNFLKQESTFTSIKIWVQVLSETQQIHIPFIADGDTYRELQNLYADDPSEEERCTIQDNAKQVVTSLLSACLKAFPDRFEALGFPTTMDEVEQLKPYDLAIIVFSRWSTEAELIKELSEYIPFNLSTSPQNLIQFSVQAILYRSNILIKPKYRELFMPICQPFYKKGCKSVLKELRVKENEKL